MTSKTATAEAVDADLRIVSAAEWQTARDTLLVKEKAMTRALDALAAERRRLPMVPIDNWEDSPAGWPQTPPYQWCRRRDEYGEAGQ